MSRRVVIKQVENKFTRWSCFKRALRDSWQKFSETSSIHGIRYLSENCSTVQKAFWSAILLISSVVVSVFIYYLWLRYMESPTKIIVKSQHIPSFRLPFPAVTICHSNMVDKRKFLSFVNKSTIDFGFNFTDSFEEDMMYRAIIQVSTAVDHEIATSEDILLLDRFLQFNQLDFFDFLNNISMSCEDIFDTCWWNYEPLSCESGFTEIMSTNGMCCSFNIITMGMKNSVALHPNGFGLFSGLDVIINSSRLSEYGERAFRVFIHDPLTFPTSTIEHFIAAEHKETAFAINSALVTSDYNLRGLALKNRKCVFKEEYTLNYFKSFTYENCISECQINRFNKLCGCIPHYFWLETRAKIKMCTPKQYLCIMKIFRKMLNLSLSKVNNLCDTIEQVLDIQGTIGSTLACKCPIECDLLMLDVKFMEWDFVKTNLSVNSFYSGISSSDTLLHFYLTRSTAVEYSKVLSLQGLTFTANLGGLTSSFLGCSFVSVFELAYIFLYGLWERYKQLRSDSKLFYFTKFYLKLSQRIRK